MTVVNLKCPNCNNSMSFPGENKDIKCDACGTSSYFKTDKNEIKIYITNNQSIGSVTVIGNTEKGPDIENLLELTKQSYRSHNFDECYKYSTMILESDPKNPKAWIYKGLSAGYTSSLAHFRSKEVLTGYKNALLYANEKEKKSIKNYSREINQLAQNFVNQSRDHSIEYMQVDGASAEHRQDIQQAVSLLLEVFKISNDINCAKSIVDLTQSYPEFKQIRNSMLTSLKKIEPQYVDNKANADGFEKMLGCVFGAVILVIVVAVIYWIVSIW